MNAQSIQSLFQQPDRLGIIAGPCLAESWEVMAPVAEKLKALERKLGIAFVFKSSYRKANRTSAKSFTGIGDAEALILLARIKTEFGLPILTDVHAPAECTMAASVADVLQIPAFLARQSDLLLAAADTGKVINIKKGQFMAPQDMLFAREKVTSTGNPNVLLTERGTFFGYGDLVVDFRSIEIMQSFGSPVIFDATHSVQRPSQQGISSGSREFIPVLARAAVAAGVGGLFIETHPDPTAALSDKDSQLPLSELEALLTTLVRVKDSIR